MHQRAALVLAALSAASALALAGCGNNAGSGSSSSAAPSSSASTSSAPPSTASSSPSSAELSLMTSSVGGQTIIVDNKGNTVYVYTRDNPGATTSACTGGCATLWPAVTSDMTPTLKGITGKLGTITTASGKTQVTINGMPIYYYSKDTAPGQTNGQGTAGVWYVVGADGNMIQTPLTGSSGSPNTSGY
ncbi:hypothetical protein [Sinomonas albida]|uniref:COG4315 family predicted lipoprotein n=1 Tax=Sinomonas albida TaxID=369942 RepID=UPI003015E7CB